MTYDWALWKARVTDDSVRFLHISDLPASGFASVYCFSEADARSMEKLGTYRSFKGTVHCPTLKIDCDTEDASEATERRLKEEGFAYRKYATGNRGHHYHVERIVGASHVLPALDKALVEERFPGTDVSFYHHVGWYRQEGATHLKTGNKKALLADVAGRPLDMRDFQLPTFAKWENCPQFTNNVIGSIFSDFVLQRMTVPYEKGERRNRFCAIAARLKELNQPLPWAFAYLANVNLLCEERLADGELHRILDWAYFQRGAK